jgi:hypothetical protein
MLDLRVRLQAVIEIEDDFGETGVLDLKPRTTDLLSRKEPIGSWIPRRTRRI